MTGTAKICVSGFLSWGVSLEWLISLPGLFNQLKCGINKTRKQTMCTLKKEKRKKKKHCDWIFFFFFFVTSKL